MRASAFIFLVYTGSEKCVVSRHHTYDYCRSQLIRKSCDCQFVICRSQRKEYFILLQERFLKIAKIYGETKGLSPGQRKDLEKLYRRRIDRKSLITAELARQLADRSAALNRQIAVLIDRKGSVTHVIAGDFHSITIPDISRFRRGSGRLRGLRCIHTHLGRDHGLSLEDLTDMALLRLDAMVAVEVQDNLPGTVHMGHLLPPNPAGERWHIDTFRHASQVDIPFEGFILELEQEIEQKSGSRQTGLAVERAMLVHAGPAPADEAERSLSELRELARSAGVEVVEVIRQRVIRYNPGHLMGKGKLRDILMQGLYLGATMIIFDQELSPVQVNNIARMVDLKVIDRTQLILDIFARRARSRGGKLQVELAQLRYLLPRLVGRGTAMSRLMGGIGGRGPGETKLEVDRRRVKQRISSLERELKGLRKGRRERRKKRNRAGMPVVSIIGYTNAGKSTLLNRLTGSDVLAENRLFATLDPTTRRIRFDSGTEVLLADTVGFIRNMPADIRTAFRSTLEELEDASLFLHVVDASSPFKKEEISAVEDILEEMNLSHVPRLVLFNKADTLKPNVSQDTVQVQSGRPDRMEISALTGMGLGKMKEVMDNMLGRV